MKRLIEGRVFDTEEMDVIAETVLSGEYCTDFGYHAVEILVDENGNFFKCNYYCFAQENTLELVTKQDVINWCEEINYDMDDDNLLANLELGGLKMKKRFEILSSSEVLDTETNLIWRRQPSSEQMNYLEAERYPDKFTQNWRLPTIKELISLTEYSEVNPSLPVGHTFVGVVSSWYWSSSQVKMYPDNVWSIDFSDGDVCWNDKDTSTNYVWLVRDN